MKDAARAHSLPAIATLAKALKDKNSRVRIMAATALLDRAWGKPAQEVHHSGGGEGTPPIAVKLGLSGLSDKEIDQLENMAERAVVTSVSAPDDSE